MDNIRSTVERIQSYINQAANLNISMTDYVEILILSILVYYFLIWIKRTRAWNLLKGIVVLLGFILLAFFFNMSTILFISENILNFGIIAIAVVFQPELRKVLEQLGEKKFVSSIIPFDGNKDSKGRFSDKTINELVKATFEMAKVKTGALIVIEENILLTEYERTGIELDSIVSAQLLINIFEHNTPLHDGAIIIRGNRIVAATCYLPLSDSVELSKELGTRHRAGLGISEITDSFTIIISEETGNVSVASNKELIRNVDAETLRTKLIQVQNKLIEEKRFRLWKGRQKDEKKVDE